MAIEKEELVNEEPFEKYLERLETIVRALEKGEVPLEQSLALFEEGIQIARICSQRLNEVEGKIEVLLRMENDQAVVAPFTDADAKED